MKVFIVNFGLDNYLWPKCLKGGSIAIHEQVRLLPIWMDRDRQGYIDEAMNSAVSLRGRAPTRAVASRWFNLNLILNATADDIWIHRQGDDLWWTRSRDAQLLLSLEGAYRPDRDGPKVHELHKPCEPRSREDSRGRALRWASIHPKAQDFLFARGTFQKLNGDNAHYAQALFDGDDLTPWHNRPDWEAKAEQVDWSPPARSDERTRAIRDMVASVKATVRSANGQQEAQTVKNKEMRFSEEELATYIDALLAKQKGLCALTGLRLRYGKDGTDPDLRCSLDRIDSDGHYEAGNLQVVCWFANRWKRDDDDERFRELLGLVRSTGL